MSTTDKPTDRTPTKPGWYAARWDCFNLAKWHCVEVVERGASMLVRRDGALHTFLDIAEWGPNIDDALAALAAIQRALSDAGVTGDASGVAELVRRVTVHDGIGEILSGFDEGFADRDARIIREGMARAERDIAASAKTRADNASRLAREAAAAGRELVSECRQSDSETLLNVVRWASESDYPKADPETARTDEEQEAVEREIDEAVATSRAELHPPRPWTLPVNPDHEAVVDDLVNRRIAEVQARKIGGCPETAAHGVHACIRVAGHEPPCVWDFQVEGLARTEPAAKCGYCGELVGNPVFTVCDTCWDKYPIGTAPRTEPAADDPVRVALAAARELVRWDWLHLLDESTHSDDVRSAVSDLDSALTAIDVAPPAAEPAPHGNAPLCPKCGWANLTIRTKCRNCGDDLVMHPDPSTDAEVRWDAEDGRRSDPAPTADP